MKVMKFGGTSVGSVNSILNVKRIVEAQKEPVIVVVSALGGITDKLINTSKIAAEGNVEYENEFREIVIRHIDMVKAIIQNTKEQERLLRIVGELLNELKDIYQGLYLIKDLSPKTSATIVSYGDLFTNCGGTYRRCTMVRLTHFYQNGKETFQTYFRFRFNQQISQGYIRPDASHRLGSRFYLYG